MGGWALTVCARRRDWGAHRDLGLLEMLVLKLRLVLVVVMMVMMVVRARRNRLQLRLGLLVMVHVVDMGGLRWRSREARNRWLRSAATAASVTRRRRHGLLGRCHSRG